LFHCFINHVSEKRHVYLINPFKEHSMLNLNIYSPKCDLYLAYNFIVIYCLDFINLKCWEILFFPFSSTCLCLSSILYFCISSILNFYQILLYLHPFILESLWTLLSSYSTFFLEFHWQSLVNDGINVKWN